MVVFDSIATPPPYAPFGAKLPVHMLLDKNLLQVLVQYWFKLSLAVLEDSMLDLKLKAALTSQR